MILRTRNTLFTTNLLSHEDSDPHTIRINMAGHAARQRCIAVIDNQSLCPAAGIPLLVPARTAVSSSVLPLIAPEKQSQGSRPGMTANRSPDRIDLYPALKPGKLFLHQ